MKDSGLKPGVFRLNKHVEVSPYDRFSFCRCLPDS